jgi:hypothetical protein
MESTIFKFSPFIVSWKIYNQRTYTHMAKLDSGFWIHLLQPIPVPCHTMQAKNQGNKQKTEQELGCETSK